MATFRKTMSGWQAKIARSGVRKAKTLPTKREAQDWATRQERLILDGEGANRFAPQILLEVLNRYAKVESPKKKGERWEVLRLKLVPGGLPPLKWSSAMFRKMQETHGQQAIKARRDCHEVAAG